MNVKKSLLSALALGVTASTASAAFVYSETADQEARSDGSVTALGNSSILAGAYYGSGPGTVPVFVFQLPTLAPGQSFGTATLTLDLRGISGVPTFNGDLVGIRFNAAATVVGGDWGAAGTSIQSGFYTPTSTTGLSNTSGPNLVDWLNTSSGGENAFIKVTSGGTTAGGYVGYNISSGNETDNARKPTLTYTVVPEPSSLALLGLGGLGLMLRRRRSA